MRFSTVVTLWSMMMMVPAPRAQVRTDGVAAANSGAFDVVSIKPSAQDGYLHTRIGPDGFQASHITLQQLIFFSYSRAEESRSDDGLVLEKQVTGLPGWATTKQFDLTAKIDDEMVRRLAALSYRERGALYQAMLRPVLKERFALAYQESRKQQPVYFLDVAAQGSRLAVSSTPPTLSSLSSGNAQIRARGYTAGDLSAELSEVVGRVVVDRTRLSGVYDYSLKWRPDDPKDQDNTLPSIFTALEEQLGLRLTSGSAAIEMLNVTHAELPVQN